MLIQPAGRYSDLAGFIEATHRLVQVDTYKEHFGETDMISNLQGQVGYSAGIEKPE
ncbi:hypothetical protein D3C80_1757770 [compost metagenome]